MWPSRALFQELSDRLADAGLSAQLFVAGGARGSVSCYLSSHVGELKSSLRRRVNALGLLVTHHECTRGVHEICIHASGQGGHA